LVDYSSNGFTVEVINVDCQTRFLISLLLSWAVIATFCSEFFVDPILMMVGLLSRVASDNLSVTLLRLKRRPD
jgi:hypothetical protein